MRSFIGVSFFKDLTMLSGMKVCQENISLNYKMGEFGVVLRQNFVILKIVVTVGL